MSLEADLDRVLAEDDWLRRMARRLVSDPAASDDVAQDAWVAALTRGRSDKPWLFGVLRNLVRERARRAGREVHESEVSSPAESPATDEVAAELLLRKRVTESLLELDEPYRTALFLRYVQEESLPAIAKRCGVAVSTAHQRIARGLAQLRTRLDDHYAGERRTWALALLSMGRPPAVASSLAGGLVVGVSTKVVAAALVVGGALAWVWGGTRSEEPAAPVVPAVVADSSDASDEVPSEPPAPETERTLVASGAGESGATDVETGLPSDVLVGRVIDLGGRPVPAVRVALEGGEEAVETDGTGRFTWSFSSPVPEAPRFVCTSPRYSTLLAGSRSPEGPVVLVAERVDLAGVVVDPDGNPIVGADLRLDLEHAAYARLGLARPLEASRALRELETDSLGRFELPGACGGRGVALWVEAGGYRAETVRVPATTDLALRVVLEPQADARMLSGIVVEATGERVEGARVSAGQEIVLTDEHGEFQLAWQLTVAGTFRQREDGVFTPTHDTRVLRAVLPGFLPAEMPVEELATDEGIVLVLGDRALAVEGRVVDERGRPRGGVMVWATGLSPFGAEYHDSGSARAVWQRTIEELGAATSGGCGALADGEGRFRLTGLLDREYELVALDPRTGTFGGSWTVRAGSEGVELLLATEPGTVPVSGRLLTESGAPIVDAWIVPRRVGRFSAAERPHYTDAREGTRTDEEGRFAFDALATEGTTLEVQHDSLFIRHVPLADHADLDDLLLVEPALCELQLELAGDPATADRFALLDDDGERLEVLESYGVFFSAGDSAQVVDGRSGVVRVLESARTVVLEKAGVEVLRRPVRLDPTERTTLVL